MTHSVCRGDGADGEFEYFQRLWSRLLDPETDFATKLEETFAAESAEFDLPYAFLSRIDRNDRTQRIQIAHGSHDLLQPGETAPLGRTYCRKTIADPEGSMAVSDAPAEGWTDDPAYETFGLGSYLGTTVTTDDGLYGTLCFASSEPRAEAITDREVALAGMLGRWASYDLAPDASRETGPEPGTPGDAGTRAAVLDPRLDGLIDALRARERRAVLLGLRDGTVRHRTDVTVPGTDADRLQTALRHNHLPKLASAGIVDWDRETGAIAAGPDFGEIDPLLGALDGYAADDRPGAGDESG